MFDGGLHTVSGFGCGPPPSPLVFKVLTLFIYRLLIWIGIVNQLLPESEDKNELAP